MSSVTAIPTIAGELFAKFQTSFYSDPVDAVFKEARKNPLFQLPNVAVLFRKKELGAERRKSVAWHFLIQELFEKKIGDFRSSVLRERERERERERLAQWLNGGGKGPGSQHSLLSSH